MVDLVELRGGTYRREALVDAMARAIADSDRWNDYADIWDQTWEDHSEPMKEMFRDQARTALDALTAVTPVTRGE